jgi:hypothetical protein
MALLLQRSSKTLMDLPQTSIDRMIPITRI